MLRDMCAHVAALRPAYVRKEDIPAKVLASETELARKQAEEQAAGKPANVLDKIAEGKLRTWMAATVLLEQPMANQVKYPKKTVGELLKAAKLDLVSFVRYKVGELS
jgi:elongation factor Ts